jgi:hypothetical protein
MSSGDPPEGVSFPLLLVVVAGDWLLLLCARERSRARDRGGMRFVK